MSEGNSVVRTITNVIFGGLWGLLGVFLFIFTQIIATFICLFAGLDLDIYEGTYSFVAAITGLLFIGFLAFLRGNLSFKKNTLVFHDKLTLETIIPVIFISFGLMGIVMLYFFVTDFFAELIPKVASEVDTYNEALDRYANVEATEIPVFDSWLNLFALCILVPIVEELTFRGILLGELLRRIKPAYAIIISALVFGVMHGFSVQIGYAFISGIIIGYVYYVTHSIWATITLHAIFNFFGAGFDTFLNSGIFGDVSVFAREVNSWVSYLSLLMILPTFVSLAFLWQRRKNLLLMESIASDLNEDSVKSSAEA